MRHTSYTIPAALASLLFLGLACGGGSDASGPPDGPTLTVAKASPSGDAQSAAVSTQLPQPLRVLVRRDGTPAAGVAVAWSVTAGGGSVAPASSGTDADGIASTLWTLGAAAGGQGVRATVQGASGSPVSFTATATGGGAANIVRVENNVFAPATITVAAGTTVVWEWVAGSLNHNIVPVAPATIPSSPDTRDGPATYQVNFPTPGSYQYFCSVHGTATSGMRGTVVVQ
ncbi:MAG TPA: plastocyanin/azurin family copper-binding protein [Gemmatimonadales bacterium]